MVVFGEEAPTMEKIMELAGKAAKKGRLERASLFLCLVIFLFTKYELNNLFSILFYLGVTK
jgi:hypothetical protein